MEGIEVDCYGGYFEKKLLDCKICVLEEEW